MFPRKIHIENVATGYMWSFFGVYLSKTSRGNSNGLEQPVRESCDRGRTQELTEDRTEDPTEDRSGIVEPSVAGKTLADKAPDS